MLFFFNTNDRKCPVNFRKYFLAELFSHAELTEGAEFLTFAFGFVLLERARLGILCRFQVVYHSTNRLQQIGKLVLYHIEYNLSI